MKMQHLNESFTSECLALFHTCCSSSKWCTLMEKQRPFSSLETLLSLALQQEQMLTDVDWQEAFSGHPRVTTKQSRFI